MVYILCELFGFFWAYFEWLLCIVEKNDSFTTISIEWLIFLFYVGFIYVFKSTLENIPRNILTIYTFV